MNYYTVFYLVIILFIMFKNDIFLAIIDFNLKYNTKDFMNNILLNKKKLIMFFFLFYLLYKITFTYKIIILILSIIIYLNYTKINFILNQFKDVYDDKFLINKFIL